MSKVLVAYFSASGVTKKLAQKLAGVIGADLFEIVPEEPYTKADLNWMNRAGMSQQPVATSLIFWTVFLGFKVFYGDVV